MVNQRVDKPNAGFYASLTILKVVANSSSSRYKGKDADLREVAKALDVTGILAGKVLQRDGTVSIGVERIDGRDRTQVWGEHDVRKAADLIQVQADISRGIADTLQLRLTQGQRERLDSRDIKNPEARANGNTRKRLLPIKKRSRWVSTRRPHGLAH